MNDLPPIPTPLSLRLREFRVTALPPVVFCVIVGLVIWLWQQVGAGNSLMGIGDGVRSVTTSPVAGYLRELKVEPYQMVNAGDPIAVIEPVDPRAQLDLLQSELQISRIRSAPSLAEDNAMNYERIRVELLRTKSELAMAKANLELAINNVRRNEPLYKEKLVSEDIYDLSLKTRDLYAAEVTEKGKAVAEIEDRMERLRSMGDPQLAVTNDAGSHRLMRLESMQASAATNWAPIILRAPISGMVNTLYRQQDEYVADGELVVGINSPWANRIVGFLRQPFSVEPIVGAKVLVSARNLGRQSFWTQITQVGAQLETITNSLAFIKQGALTDSGLPVVVSVPNHIRIRPGEVVDMMIQVEKPTKAPVQPSPTQPSSAPDSGRPREAQARL